MVMDEQIMKSAALDKFTKKGHNTYYQDDKRVPFTDPDVIIGPRCWRIDPQLKLGDDSTQEESLERQLEMMEKGVRMIKYPKGKKDE